MLTKKFISFLSIIFVFITINAYSQKTTSEERKTLKQARRLLDNEKYNAAQEKYQKLVTLNPTNDEYNFEAGLSFYLSNKERAKSIPYFEAALKNSKEDTIPELYYYLARAYHLNSDFDKSKEAFYKFKPSIKKNTLAGRNLTNETDYFIDKTEAGKKFLVSKNETIEVTNLGNNINSEYGEYAPVYREDKNILLFTSRRKNSNHSKLAVDLLPYEDIYVAKKSTDTWELISDENELAKHLPKDINTKKHDAGIIYSSDGKRLYTYKSDKIWQSNFENNTWTALELLDKTVNSSKYNIPSVSISSDGKTLLFVSERKEGLGGKDIYQSSLNADGKWSEATNLGAEINTKYDEESPFLSDDGKTLYFSSKGHEGIGGYDVFKSELINGEWTKPINMGIPINSPADDVFLIIDKEEKNGFFSSSRDGGIGGMDIYSIAPTIKRINHIINGLLVNENEKSVNNAKLNFIASNPDSILTENLTVENGSFNLISNREGKHTIDVNAENYLPQSVALTLPEKSSTANLKITLSKTETPDNNLQLMQIVSDELGLNLVDTLITPKTKTDEIAIVDNNEKNTDKNNDLGSFVGSYNENFNYNSKQINTSHPTYIELINKAVKQVELNGKVYVDFEASSSKVPTKTYGSNQNLSKARLDEAQQIFVNELINKGVSKDKIIINDTKSLVQGPTYIGDYKNEKKYTPYQYLIIKIR
ncbi:MAG: hypothetical protein K0B10_11310 [Vicingaceae bacterium]|nr:hypothetical protein [Vicingaceae bacterium]